jgi:hypothetical protein
MPANNKKAREGANKRSSRGLNGVTRERAVIPQKWENPPKKSKVKVKIDLVFNLFQS